jgi:hypothetical protein
MMAIGYYLAATFPVEAWSVQNFPVFSYIQELPGQILGHLANFLPGQVGGARRSTG